LITVHGQQQHTAAVPPATSPKLCVFVLAKFFSLPSPVGTIFDPVVSVNKGCILRFEEGDRRRIPWRVITSQLGRLKKNIKDSVFSGFLEWEIEEINGL
jgi:hypothetical protein